MLTENPTSRELPSPAPRHLPIPLGHLARKIVPAGNSTALPMYPSEDSRAVNVGIIADGRHAARLLFMFDTSTHDALNTVAPPLLRQDLENALEDLRATPDEAKDDGYPQPTEIALTNAGRILRQMYAMLPTRLEVYPTPEGEVAIVAPAPRRSVMVLCESDGGALCMVNMDGKHRRARYSTADSLPDGFLRDALNELAHGDG